MNPGMSALFLSVAVTAPISHMIENIANNWETTSSKINLLASELIKGLSKVILVFSTGYLVGSLAKDFSIGLGAVLGLTIVQFLYGWISNLRKGSHQPSMVTESPKPIVEQTVNVTTPVLESKI